jgi:hypothetical protein
MYCRKNQKELPAIERETAGNGRWGHSGFVADRSLFIKVRAGHERRNHETRTKREASQKKLSNVKGGEIGKGNNGNPD